MSEFTYLYRGGEDPGSPEEMQARMQKWGIWLNGLKEQGYIKEFGHPLENGGAVVSGKQKTVTDGSYAEKDVVGGFTIVIANDLAQAIELSMDCPIFDTGGAVEVRPVINMGA